MCAIVWYIISWEALVHPRNQKKSTVKETAISKWKKRAQIWISRFRNIQKRLTHIFEKVGGKSIHRRVSGISTQRITQYIKIYISFFQVLSSFLTFHVTWPALLLSTMAWVKGTLFLDIVQLPGLSCLWVGVDFQQRLLTYTLGPLLVVCAFLVPILCAILLKYRKSNDPDKVGIWDSVADAAWKNIMFWLFLVYPIVSLTTLQAFDCSPAGLGRLAADFNEPCPSNGSLLRIWSFTFILVYPFGIPLFCFIAMVSMGVHLVARDKIEASILRAVVAKYIDLTTHIESRRIAGLFNLAANDNEGMKETIEELWAPLIDHEGHLSAENMDDWKKQFGDSDPERVRVIRRLDNYVNKGASISKNEFKSTILLERQIEKMYPVFCNPLTEELKDVADIKLVGVDPDAIRNFFFEYDQNSDGKISIDEFSDMVHEIVKKSNLFTGVESDRLTKEQAIALLIYDWKSKKLSHSPNISKFVSEWNKETSAESEADPDNLNIGSDILKAGAKDYEDMANIGKKSAKSSIDIKNPEGIRPDANEDLHFETQQEMESRLLSDCKSDDGKRAVADQIRKLGWQLIRDKIISVPDISWDSDMPNASGKTGHSAENGAKTDLENFVIHPDIMNDRTISNLEKFLASGTFQMPKDWQSVNSRNLLETKAISRVGFVFQAYKVNFWFWEMLEMLRK